VPETPGGSGDNPRRKIGVPSGNLTMGKPWENHGEMVIYIEHSHRNSLFSHGKWWGSIVFCIVYQGVSL